MAKRKQSKAPVSPISHTPRHGLLVSTRSRFPQSADDKVIVAKSIVQAVVSAHDAGNMDGENYDIHWPLSMAIDLLEQASEQLSAPQK